MKKLTSIGLLVLAAMEVSFVPSSESWAQEKCKRSGTYLPQDIKFTQQHVIDVGDVPGHQVRILEVHRTPSNAKPNCEGLKLVETWVRGYSDYTNINGRAWGYEVNILESGEKIFGQWSGTTHTTVTSDGSKKSLYTGVTTFVGGTGKYHGIRGMSRVTTLFDPKTGFNEVQWEDEYWIDN